MPILAAAYGTAVIYVTAMPVAGDNPGFIGELLTWLLTLAGIALTLFLVLRVEPKVFPEAGQFSLKLPQFTIIAGLLLIAPCPNLRDGVYLVAKHLVQRGAPRRMQPRGHTPRSLLLVGAWGNADGENAGRHPTGLEGGRRKPVIRHYRNSFTEKEPFIGDLMPIARSLQYLKT